MNDIEFGFLALIICSVLLYGLSEKPDDEKIESQKQFILNNATYICKKTNEIEGRNESKFNTWIHHRHRY